MEALARDKRVEQGVSSIFKLDASFVNLIELGYTRYDWELMLKDGIENIEGPTAFWFGESEVHCIIIDFLMIGIVLYLEEKEKNGFIKLNMMGVKIFCRREFITYVSTLRKWET